MPERIDCASCHLIYFGPSSGSPCPRCGTLPDLAAPRSAPIGPGPGSPPASGGSMTVRIALMCLFAAVICAAGWAKLSSMRGTSSAPSVSAGPIGRGLLDDIGEKNYAGPGLTKATGDRFAYELSLPAAGTWKQVTPEKARSLTKDCDQMLVRPDIGAVIVVSAMSVPPLAAPRTSDFQRAMEKSAAEITKKYDARMEVIDAQTHGAGAALARLFRVRLLRKEQPFIEAHIGIFMKSGTAYVVQVFTPAEAFAGARDEIEQIVKSFRPLDG